MTTTTMITTTMTTMTTTTNDTLTAVPGIRVGHATDLEAITGCTAILCPPNTVGGVDVRGGAPGTRETALLDPLRNVQHVNAVMLSGGSAYGLATADGAMRYLEANGIGYKTRTGQLVPIVPAAILFDLAIGRGDVRPTRRWAMRPVPLRPTIRWSRAASARGRAAGSARCWATNSPPRAGSARRASILAMA